MADKIFNLNIDVSKIIKAWLFNGKKGVYCNVTFLYNEEKDDYGQNGMIVQSVPKEIYEKDKTVKGPILGNGSEFIKGGGGAAAAAQDRETARMVGEEEDSLEGLPF